MRPHVNTIEGEWNKYGDLYMLELLNEYNYTNMNLMYTSENELSRATINEVRLHLYTVHTIHCTVYTQYSVHCTMYNKYIIHYNDILCYTLHRISFSTIFTLSIPCYSYYCSILLRKQMILF